MEKECGDKSDMTFDSIHDLSPCLCCKDVGKICEMSDVFDDSDNLFEASLADSKIQRLQDDIFTSFELRLTEESMDQIVHDIKVLTCLCS